MPIQFPELAKKTYKDIVDEMVSSIPKYSKNWTNYNPSDPGITILEILAWIFDATLYRIDRLPEESYINSLRLIAGAGGEEVAVLLDKLKYYSFSWEDIPGSDKEKIREFLMQNYDVDWIKTAKIDKINDDSIRIYTDINSLSLSLNDEKTEMSLKIDNGRIDTFTVQTENGKIKIKNLNSDRYHIDILEFLHKIEDKTKEEDKISTTAMKAVALKFIQSNYKAVTKENFEALAIEATSNRGENKPKVKRAKVDGNPDGNVEIIIISDQLDHYKELKETVKKYLEPRKLICTKIIVKEPVYSPLNIYIEVVYLPNVITHLASKKIKDNITEFLDPLRGGDEKKGWVYGRDVTIFELFHIIEETEGVDHAESVVMDENPSLKIKQIEGLIHPINITVNVVGNK